MAVTIRINGKAHQAREGQLIIDACQDAGILIPRYCYHPGLPVVGSCRMCLVQLEGQPKLIPSCQTLVREGINVLTDTDAVRANQRAVMEFLLINHPLDCPVCDQAGECYLQDYSYRHGRPISRFVEPKIKQPKKDVGCHVLLYMDRCILCSRCVRFTREVSGRGELTIVHRGSGSEIDIFPGRPLDDKLSGNVVDLCPVGALLDKHFLHSQRAWFLQGAPSVCARCPAGCNITVEHNAGRAWRVKPRINLDVNGHWICDEGRFGFDYIHRDDRLDHRPRVRPGDDWRELDAPDAAEAIRSRLADLVQTHGLGALAAVLSPMWTTEEQFLLARLIRSLDPQATLAVGPAPVVGQDITFKGGFTIYAEKAPNRRGGERVLVSAGGPVATFDELLAAAASGKIKGLYLAGGYPPDVSGPDRGPDEPVPAVEPWLIEAQSKALAGADGLTLIAHDLFDQPAHAGAFAVLAGASWAEKDGTFVNVTDRVQRLTAAPIGGRFTVPEAKVLWQLAGEGGAFSLAAVWRMMEQANVAGYPPPASAPSARPNPYAGL